MGFPLALWTAALAPAAEVIVRAFLTAFSLHRLRKGLAGRFGLIDWLRLRPRRATGDECR